MNTQAETGRESSPVLTVPGLFGSGAEHWQTLWEREHPEIVRVEQDDWERPRLEAWIGTLEQAVSSVGSRPLLVAHSLGVALVAHWASRSDARVRAALLVAPADVDARDRTPDLVRGFAPMPLRPLPFPSIVVASDDDPYVAVERAAYFADCWRSRLVRVGELGHINAESKLGHWPRGLALLDQLRG